MKPLSSRHVLKTFREILKGKSQKEKYLLAVGFNSYIWYQSQTPGDVLARRLSLEGGGHEMVCEEERWFPKGVDWGSHINWRRGRVVLVGEENKTPLCLSNNLRVYRQ